MKNFLLLIAAFCCSFFTITTAQNSPQWAWMNASEKNRTSFISNIVADNTGNIYTSGTFKDTFKFGGEILITTGTHIFLMKQTSSGDLIWLKQVDQASNIPSDRNSTSALAITPDSKSVYLSGFFDTRLVVSGTTYTSKGMLDLFVMKLDTAGVFQWIKVGGGSLEDIMIFNSTLAHPDGGVIIGGRLDSKDATFDGQSVINNANKRGNFLIRYDSLGNLMWVNCDISTGSGFVSGIAIDKLGRIYATGLIEDSSANYGGILLYRGGYVARYSSLGVLEKVQSFVEFPSKIAIDGDLNIYISELRMSRLYKFDSQMNILWERVLDTKDAFPGDIEIDKNNNIYTCGKYNRLIFNGDTINSVVQNGVVLKWSPSGNIDYVKHLNVNTQSPGPSSQIDIFKFCLNSGSINVAGTSSKGSAITTGNLPQIVFPYSSTSGSSQLGFFTGSLQNATSIARNPSATGALNSFVAYPNPANLTVQLAFANPLAEPTTIKLVDVVGRVLLVEKLPAQSQFATLTLSAAIPAGMYMVAVNGVGTEKITVVR